MLLTLHSLFFFLVSSSFPFSSKLHFAFAFLFSLTQAITKRKQKKAELMILFETIKINEVGFHHLDFQENLEINRELFKSLIILRWRFEDAHTPSQAEKLESPNGLGRSSGSL